LALESLIQKMPKLIHNDCSRLGEKNFKYFLYSRDTFKV